MSTVIVDYGAGNIRSVVNALQELGAVTRVADSARDLEDADRIILPGVGAMPAAMSQLESKGLKEALHRSVYQKGIPFLGICLGMQLMCQVGFEGQMTAGLGWVNAEVTALPPTPPDWRVPHMGWAEVEVFDQVPIFDSVSETAAFYFCHSYAVNAVCDQTVGGVRFGSTLVSAVLWRGNAIGVQFHPERSGNNGLQVLGNFLAWSGKGRHW